jgi:polyhydroxybutyrate depolymerase
MRRSRAAVFLILLIATSCRSTVRSSTATVTPTTATPTTATPTTVVAAASSCVAELKSGSRSARTIESSGGTREYTIVIPASYRAPAPLLIDLHGHGGNGNNAIRAHGFEPLAQQHGFVLVAPTGATQRDGLHGWSTGAPTRDSGNVDDTAFVSDLIDEVTRLACIDTSRVWVVGHSNGGGMATVLACELPNKIAAFASLAGAVYNTACSPGGAVPFIEVHGLADATVPYTGNATRAIPDVLQDRATLNGCTDRVDAPVPATKATRSTWTCPATSPLVHIALAGHGHSWPAPTTFDATQAIYDFVSQFRLASAALATA